VGLSGRGKYPDVCDEAQKTRHDIRYQAQRVAGLTGACPRCRRLCASLQQSVSGLEVVYVLFSGSGNKHINVWRHAVPFKNQSAASCIDLLLLGSMPGNKPPPPSNIGRFKALEGADLRDFTDGANAGEANNVFVQGDG